MAYKWSYQSGNRKKWSCKGEPTYLIPTPPNVIYSFPYFCSKQINTAKLKSSIKWDHLHDKRAADLSVLEWSQTSSFDFPAFHLHSTLPFAENPSHLESLLFPPVATLALRYRHWQQKNANTSLCVHVQLPFSLISIPWNYPSTTKIYQHVFPESCQTFELNPSDAEWRRSCGRIDGSRSFSSERKDLHLKSPSTLMKASLTRAQQCCKLVISSIHSLYKWNPV